MYKCTPYHMLAVAKESLAPGRHREQASEQRCTFGPTTFSSVQFSSVWRCRDGVVWIVVVVHDDGAGHDSRPRRLEFDAGDCFCRWRWLVVTVCDAARGDPALPDVRA